MAHHARVLRDHWKALIAGEGHGLAPSRPMARMAQGFAAFLPAHPGGLRARLEG
jgi:hypothetical protein